jgi:endonuclease YncB( thermonuclease family)
LRQRKTEYVTTLERSNEEWGGVFSMSVIPAKAGIQSKHKVFHLDNFIQRTEYVKIQYIVFMFKLPFKILSGLFTLIIIVGGLLYIFLYPNKNSIPVLIQEENDKREAVFVQKVVDDNTFLLSNGQRVKLLGMDTPEKFVSKKLDKDTDISRMNKKTIQKLGQIVSDYIKNIVEGKKVFLEKEPNYDDKDRYNRLLRWIYLEDGTFVNGKIVKDGYAQVYEKFPVSKLEELRNYQKEARENNRGLWGNVEGLQR